MQLFLPTSKQALLDRNFQTLTRQQIRHLIRRSIQTMTHFLVNVLARSIILATAVIIPLLGPYLERPLVPRALARAEAV